MSDNTSGTDNEVETIRIYYKNDSSDDESQSVNEKELPPKKRSRKSKKNVSTNNSVGISTTSDFCQICSTKIRCLSEHLQSVHNLNTNSKPCMKVGEENESIDQKELEVEDIDGEELDNSEAEDETSDISQTKSTKKRTRDKQIRCNKCADTSFTNYADIESHLKAVHSEESKCIVCEKERSNPFSLLHHMRTIHGKLKSCKLCMVSFNSRKELAIHYKSEEHNTKCSVCQQQFKNRRALYEHRGQKHLNPKTERRIFKCPECPKEFAFRNNRRRHFTVAHNDLKFLCDTCGLSYSTKDNLRLHIQKFHEGLKIEKKETKKFVCEICGKEINIHYKYHITVHKASHQGHNFVCKKCYESFATKTELKKHVEDLGHQLLECDKCQATFVELGRWKAHLKGHDGARPTKNIISRWVKYPDLRNEKGELVCSYCSKIYKQKQRFDIHLRTHTNERPYTCHICGKAFKMWCHRKLHMDVHLGFKKWVCKFCGITFMHSSALKDHEMLHTGETRHTCPECKKRFIKMSTMKIHMKVHLKTRSSNYGQKKKRCKKGRGQKGQ